MDAVVREYFRQRRLTGDMPVVCWHVALINVIGSDAAWDMVSWGSGMSVRERTIQ